MMIQQIEHKYSEEHIMESTTVNKKNTSINDNNDNGSSGNSTAGDHGNKK